jgi:hypothetical protein
VAGFRRWGSASIAFLPATRGIGSAETCTKDGTGVMPPQALARLLPPLQLHQPLLAFAAAGS